MWNILKICLLSFFTDWNAIFKIDVSPFSAKQVITPYGDILVTLAQGQGGTPADEPIREWHDSWQVVGSAAYADFILSDVQPFDSDEYPLYNSTGFRLVCRF